MFVRFLYTALGLQAGMLWANLLIWAHINHFRPAEFPLDVLGCMIIMLLLVAWGDRKQKVDEESARELKFEKD
jgi:hypothetical protein